MTMSWHHASPVIRGLLLVLLWLLTGTKVCSVETSDQARVSARDLGYEGLEAYEAGDLKTAAEKLAQAYQVLPVPTLALWLGRVYEKQGRLVEAYERYSEAARLSLEPGAREVQRRAQLSAATEREALLPRIPKLVVKVVGAPRREVRVLVHGKPLENALIGVSASVNPGQLTVVGQFGDQRVSRQVTLGESARVTVVLEFEAPSTTPTVTLDPTPSSIEPGAKGDSADGNGASPAQGPEDAWSTRRVWGYGILGVGVAGFAVGVTAGVVALRKRSVVDRECVNAQCPASAQGDLDAYSTAGTISGLGFLVGVAGVGAGLWLLYTDSSETENSGTHQVQGLVGPNGVIVRGRF